MNHAVFWVTFSALPTSYELTLFLQFASSHIAVSHLSRPIAESSKIVPTLTLNCLRHSRHVQIRRGLRNERFLAWQRGHFGTFGHLALATASRHTIGADKYRRASTTHH